MFTPEEKIANCFACTLAPVMRKCKMCDFKIGLEYPVMCPARYAKNMIAVRCPSIDGWKSVYGVIAGNITKRYSGREKAYIMSKAQHKRFVEEIDKL